ncbi:MAG TPA: adenylyl-sulfate kinase [Bacteroidia bacterium]|jgi:adenylylsulfate kinase|nr:adenylyl-sulfate kinase [Bacteroidia bacterium]
MIVQFCGLSGAGKTTIALAAKKRLKELNIPVEIIDGDEYRAFICKDLGFNKADRMENIRRLAFIAHTFSNHDITAIICAINPYEEVRREIAGKYDNVKTVFINCSMDELKKRDTKGLYKKAFLPEGHSDKIKNLTGVNDPFEIPEKPALVLYTDRESVEESVNKLIEFIKNNL